MSGFGGEVEVDWPGPSFPSYGSAVARLELDDRIERSPRTPVRACYLALKPLLFTMIHRGGWYR